MFYSVSNVKCYSLIQGWVDHEIEVSMNPHFFLSTWASALDLLEGGSGG